MRTYEVPAMGGCLLAERTSDHERLLGQEGERVFYVEAPADVVSKVRWLLANASERDRLARAAHAVAIVRFGTRARELYRRVDQRVARTGIEREQRLVGPTLGAAIVEPLGWSRKPSNISCAQRRLPGQASAGSSPRAQRS